MSEELSIANLVLGIIGTVTGSIAVIIHLWKLKREKPHLRTDLMNCYHRYNPNPKELWKMAFHPHFRIDNVGDRGTTLSKVELVFRIKDKEYITLVEQPFKIDAHSTVDASPEIYSYDEAVQELPEEGVIKCSFTLFHTHGKEIVEGNSEMVM